jgi:ATP/maltotriose-dependent transcriptional regulator MalT
LSWFWSIRGYGREGLRFLEQALSYRADFGAELRARVLSAVATLPLVYTRHRQLERLVEESITVYQELGDPVGIATSLYQLGSIARITSRFALARERLEDASARFQKLSQRWNQGQCFTELARTDTAQGQYEQARARLEESLVLYQSLGDTQRIGWVRYLQARLFFLWQQDLALAQQLAAQSLALFRQQDDTLYSLLSRGLIGLIRLEQGELLAARSLLEDSVTTGKQRGIETDITEMWLGLARLSAWQGDADAARRLYRESLTLLLAFNVYKDLVAEGLEGVAALETAQGRPSGAAQLWGAAEALREAIGAPIYPVNRGRYEQAVAQTRAALSEPALRAAWAEGRLMTPQQALSAQEQEMPSSVLLAQATTSSPPQPPPSPFGLTARELEVLRLLAQGWTDAQIAEQLVISVRTVNHHTTSLYSKLGVSSRAAATRAALEHHLV